MRRCSAHQFTDQRNPCVHRGRRLYAKLHCTAQWSDEMVALIERFLDAMFAPLARELERLPPAAMRFNVFF